MFAQMKRRLKVKRHDESMSQSIKSAGAESGFRTTDSIAGLICWSAERALRHPSRRNPITCDYCSFISLLVHCDLGNTGLEVINLMALCQSMIKSIRTLTQPLAAAEKGYSTLSLFKNPSFEQSQLIGSILACVVNFSYMLASGVLRKIPCVHLVDFATSLHILRKLD